MSFAVYIVGFAILIAGLAYGASLLGVPRQWIVVGVVILAGLGIIGAAGYLRQRT
ncbi:MAG: hypothetical protein ACK5AZ_08805 [Bryobacteraceae bacterium]